MPSRRTKFCAVLPVILLISAGLYTCAVENIIATQEKPPPTATRTQSTESWLRLPGFSSSSNRADVGAEIYRLVCRSCHGDMLRGLTAEWLAQWNPNDQNCWQSKCHAQNHPPDGFTIPYYMPPLVGPGTLSRFETLLDLYNYTRIAMPWHNPGSLQDDEYWKLTLFIARERQMEIDDIPFDENRAVKQLLVH